MFIFSYSACKDIEKNMKYQILAYKNYTNLSACINSVISQTYSNIELIFADDCTPGLDKDKILQLCDALNNVVTDYTSKE